MSGNCHFLGIGGVGMSALAQLFIDGGHEVTGADRYVDAGGTTSVLEALKKQGVRIYPENGDGITADTAAVVMSTAIEETNPGLRKARELGVPVVHRAKALADALKGRKLIAVAGTCGKSTVTAILGHLLAGAGFDPVVVDGASVQGWDEGGTRVGSVRKGAGEYAVAEVDESDKSLSVFSPYATIITNASADHYSEEEMNEVFDALARRTGKFVVDGRSGAADAAADDWLLATSARLPMPGEHNKANARLALRTALAIGADRKSLAEAIETFPGVVRRLQMVGKCGDAVVIDDYAHNTEKLHAMISTVQSEYPKGAAIVWRPHGFAPLRKMMDDLAAMFAGILRKGDMLVLLPVYDAGGTATRDVSSDDLAKRIACVGSGASGEVACVRNMDEAVAMLKARSGDFGVIVTAGARDPALPHMAARLAGKE